MRVEPDQARRDRRALHLVLTPGRIAVGYLFAAVLWILFSDQAAEAPAVWPVTIGALASGLSAISAGRVDLPYPRRSSNQTS